MLLLTVLMSARAGRTLEENVRTSALSANLHPMGHVCSLTHTWRTKHTLATQTGKLAPHLSEHEHIEPIGPNQHTKPRTTIAISDVNLDKTFEHMLQCAIVWAQINGDITLLKD